MVRTEFHSIEQYIFKYYHVEICVHTFTLLKVWRRSIPISSSSRVLLASAFTFDPSIGDAFSCFSAAATLVIYPRSFVLEKLDMLLQNG
jgi:hypothetical protein